jgi:sorting nexin-1/2
VKNPNQLILLLVKMDTFDDLLEPSRRALEENPFEDPFAKRSNSPDPWSSYAHQADVYPDSTEIYKSEYEEAKGSTPTGSFVTADQDERVESSSVSTSDPLDAAGQPTDEDDVVARSGIPRSPGFMESVPQNFSEIETIRPTLPEELEPSIPAPAYFLEPAPPPPTSLTPHKPISTASSSTSIGSASPSASAFARVTSPLDSPASLGVGRSFASLALGGETVGGWQSPQSPLDAPHTPAPNADDSDDDKPIGQSVRQSEPLMSSPVSPHYYPLLLI